MRNRNGISISGFSYLICLLPTVVFLGLRTSVADTDTYIRTFDARSPVFSFTDMESDRIGFELLSRFFKAYISENANLFLLFLVIISVVFLIVPIKKYSPDSTLTLFLFFASTEFFWLGNGARQFLSVCISFFALRYLVEKQYVRYFLFLFLAISFHATAVILIPAFFIVTAKPWSTRMWVVILLLVGAVSFSKPLLTLLNEWFLEDSIYGHYMEDVFTLDGVNPFRVGISIIPVCLCFLYRKTIAEQDDRCMNICVNFAVLNAFAFLFAGTFGGNLLGRLAEYFSVYLLLLYPMLFRYCMDNRHRLVAEIGFYSAYSLFYYYQMEITWSLQYVSSVLGISC